MALSISSTLNSSFSAPLNVENGATCLSSSLGSYFDDSSRLVMLETFKVHCAGTQGGPRSSKSKRLEPATLKDIAWQTVQATRMRICAKHRRRAARFLAVGKARLARRSLELATRASPCPRSYLALAERYRDDGELRRYEGSLRSAIAAAAMATARKGLEAGLSALKLLALHLCLEGRDKEAAKVLTTLDLSFRLSKGVLHYTVPPTESLLPKDCGAMVVDNALPPHLFEVLQEAFSPSAPFWQEHKYHDPNTGYFSYIQPLHKASAAPSTRLIEAAVECVRAQAAAWLPDVERAETAEWWAHCRCHAAGHQLHFDSAFEGETEGGAQNPICSTVLYLSNPHVGGPTLVTNQGINDTTMASSGYLVRPKLNRLTAFQGHLLHGVPPGRGTIPGAGTERRVTLMVAFWPKMQGFPYVPEQPGPAQRLPFEGSPHAWPATLLAQVNGGNGKHSKSTNAVPESTPGVAAAVSPVWERVKQRSSKRGRDDSSDPIPIVPYEKCFQGF